MIRSLLVANRGEIACRIMRTCRRLGIRTIAVFSEADARSLHVQMADEAIYLGEAPTAVSYLAVEKILTAVARSGADALHPGFGFLAENADFAQACHVAGILFVGPSPEAIAAMGNKRAAKERVAQSGVPLIPGYAQPEQSDLVLAQMAEQIGYPLMIKAAAGGGGKGMRVVKSKEALADALAGARRESQQAFGSDELILERALQKPRHIEFQVLGDHHGHILHLGERECSIQRRHQKVVEECPSPMMTAALRAQMGATAVAVAQSVAYTNAGTVEFLLDEDGSYYFLEMNTRLQVEHPVTELVTGLDLVEWQLRIAEGEALPWTQEEIQWQGHAVEVRLYAENPANDFLPTTGPVLSWQAPQGEGIRVESGIQTGDEVSIYYDPMLVKLIGYGRSRNEAIRRLSAALNHTVLLGFPHNLSFLQAILQQTPFLAGALNTNFIPEYLADWQPSGGDMVLALTAVTLQQWLAYETKSAGYWRNNPNHPHLFLYTGEGLAAEVQVTVQPSRTAPQTWHLELSLADEPLTVVLDEKAREGMWLTINGRRQKAIVAQRENHWWVHTPSGIVVLQAKSLLPTPKNSAPAGGSLRAPMPGSVLAVLVEVGQSVSKGQALIKLEAMKMEHTIRTATDGVVEAIYYQSGDTVTADAQLLKIKEV